MGATLAAFATVEWIGRYGVVELTMRVSCRSGIRVGGFILAAWVLICDAMLVEAQVGNFRDGRELRALHDIRSATTWSSGRGRAHWVLCPT